MAGFSDSHNMQPVHDGRSVSMPKNEDWNRVQRAVTTLFQQRQISTNFDLESLRVRLCNLLKSDVREFIPQYYQERLLKKGMIILREAVKEETGHSLLQKLAILWERFFCIILPKLQAIFCPIESLDCSVRSLTLLSFRDIIVLKTKLEEALTEDPTSMPPRIKQMLLVLQGVRESPLTENLVKLESMVELVISPYLRPSFLSHASALREPLQRADKVRVKNAISDSMLHTPNIHVDMVQERLFIPQRGATASERSAQWRAASQRDGRGGVRSRSSSVHEFPKSSHHLSDDMFDSRRRDVVKGSTMSLDDLSSKKEDLSQEQRTRILAEFSDLKSTVV